MTPPQPACRTRFHRALPWVAVVVLLASSCDGVSEPDGDAVRISSLSPSSIVKDSEGYSPIIIHGRNFTPGSQVYWAGGLFTPEFVSDRELRLDWTDSRWVVDIPVEVHTLRGSVLEISNRVYFRITPPAHSSSRFTVRGIMLDQRAWAAAAVSETLGYVGGLWTDSIYRLDLGGLEIDGVVRAGRVPYDMALSPDRSRIYTSGNEDATIGAVLTATGSVTSRVPLSPAPRRVAVSPNGQNVYATRTDGSLAFLHPSTFAALAPPTMIGGTVLGLAVSPDGSHLWTTSTEGDVVEVIAATRAVGRSFELAGELQDVVFGPGGTSIYVANESAGWVGRYSVATLQRLDSIPVYRPWGLAVSPDGKELWVSRSGEDVVSIFSTTTGLPIDSLDLGNGPRRISFASNRVVLIASDNYVAYVVKRK